MARTVLNKYKFEPNAQMPNGERVETVDKPWKVTSRGITWQTVATESGKLKPVPLEELEALR